MGIQILMNLFEQALKVAAKNLIVVDTVQPEIASKRYSVCLKCEYRDTEHDKCGVCHCFLDLKTTAETNRNPAKMRNEITHCPRGKWDDKEIANLYRIMDGIEPLK